MALNGELREGKGGCAIKKRLSFTAVEEGGNEESGRPPRVVGGGNGSIREDQKTRGREKKGRRIA